MMKYKLGEYITVKRFIEKEPGYKVNGNRYQKKPFRLSNAWHSKIVEQLQVMVIGKRTLSEGRCSWAEGEGVTYHPMRHFQAWLVVYDMNRKPVFVLDEDILEEN